MKTIRGRFRAAVLMGAAASVLAFAAGAKAQNQNSNNSVALRQHDNPWPYATGRSPVLAVVGDIACQPGETEPSGEASNETCTAPQGPLHQPPLCGNPRRPLRIRLRL
jgi:acid phosphatase type 7